MSISSQLKKFLLPKEFSYVIPEQESTSTGNVNFIATAKEAQERKKIHRDNFIQSHEDILTLKESLSKSAKNEVTLAKENLERAQSDPSWR